jgi:hypothetical protein
MRDATFVDSDWRIGVTPKNIGRGGWPLQMKRKLEESIEKSIG